ncbi:MAG: N-formylglutamate amidohydrolase [Gammaproteobacteria bacterium]
MTTSPMVTTRWLFSCEHGGRSVPDEYADLFRDAGEILASHRGWDAGALDVFSALSPALGDAGFPATNTRLLVDLNRSLHHPRVFSEFTRPLPAAARADIVSQWWRPWRASVAATIAGWLERGHRVQHISVHSFTPVLHADIRNADIGLLYDPARAAERTFCLRWQALLAECGWRVRRNYPYRGTADGHTPALRRRFGVSYAGIELELNQALLPRLLEPLCVDLAATLAQLKAMP